ncbi:hypothetical protein RIR_jg3218.t1 [Rhizophagus irregularis DAOM 181602=DAOM 197198]|nr:hypothetical protein RIR_jg3218.t1 [Rhizophagus irregularis DAOM 181602=DAOM 197198]
MLRYELATKTLLIIIQSLIVQSKSSSEFYSSSKMEKTRKNLGEPFTFNLFKRQELVSGWVYYFGQYTSNTRS